MKNLILAFGLFALVVTAAYAAVTAKNDVCKMCRSTTACSMCDSHQHCVLTVKGKDAKYCCSMCGEMKNDPQACQKHCSAKAAH